MKIQLGEKSARVRVAHTVLSHRHLGTRRGTEVKLSLDGRTFTARSVCHPDDNFCRRTGRKRAAEALLRKCRENAYLAGRLGKAERKAVFAAICPEYA